MKNTSKSVSWLSALWWGIAVVAFLGLLRFIGFVLDGMCLNTF